MLMNIKMHASDWRSDCIQAKRLLNSKGTAFEDIVTIGNDDVIAFVREGK